MPTQDWGVYKDSLTLGTEVSSTYEGRHITATAAELNHGNVLAVVTKGYPVIFGIVAGAHGVGVAFNTEVAGTDLIAVDTEGIWNLSVVSSDDLGNSLVVAGDPLYINTTTAVISKIRDNATQIPFGYAMTQFNGDGAAHTGAVKVHWDPRSHWLEDQEKLYFGDLMDVSIEWDGTNLEMLPLANDTGAFVIGNGTLSMDFQVFGDAAANYIEWDSSLARLNMFNTTLGVEGRMVAMHGTVATPAYPDGYGMVEIDLEATGIATLGTVAQSVWINLNSGTSHPSNVDVVSPFSLGIYEGAGATITGAPMAYGGRLSAILTHSDYNYLVTFSTNLNQVQTAIFQTNSQGNFGHVAGVHSSAVIGSYPLCCAIDGSSVHWVRVYGTAT